MRLKLMIPFIFLAMFVLLAGSQPVFAVEVWKAEYWNNRDLEGDPILVRNESGLSHEWGDGSPDSSIDTDNFSAQWSTRTYFNEGTYRFVATMDDGMRVYVDGNKIIDVWYDSQQHDVVADVNLSAGEHNIVVKYYEAGGKAAAKVTWSQIGQTIGSSGNWAAEYFNNTTLSGFPARTQTESKIDYLWGGSPAPDVNADMFSVRWSSAVPVDSGTYRFTVRADDGARLWVNGQKILDQWIEQPETTFSADIVLSAGTVPVTLEYFDHGGTAVAALSWVKIADGVTVAPAATAPQSFPNWKAEYFNNINLNGSPVLTRNDTAIQFDWGSSSPVPNLVNHDLFSVRWSRTINLPAGTYSFKTIVDDGVRIWVNDQIVLDHWTIAGGTPLLTNVTVPGGATKIRIEYFEMTGLARISLDWDQVNGSASSSGSSAAATNSSPTAPAGYASLKNARVLTLREGPGIGFDSVGYILRSSTVQLIGRNSSSFWIKVRLQDGSEGWASSKYLNSATPFNSLPVRTE